MPHAADFAARLAARQGRAPAFRDETSGRTWHFAGLEAEATALAAQFATFGRGARIAHLSYNRAESFIALFAAQKSGTLLVPLNWRAPRRELEELCAVTRPSALICDEAHAAEGAALGLPRIVIRDAGGFAPCPAGSADAGGDRAEGVALLFTSGSTGRPKAVIQTSAMIEAVTDNLAQALSLSERDRSLCYLPLCHTAGLMLLSLPLFLQGGFSHILPRYDAARLKALLAEGALSQLFAVPTIWADLATAEPKVLAALRALRGAASGGAPFPEALATQLLQSGVRVQNGYGLTESGPTGFLAGRDDAQSHPRLVGQPQPRTRARLRGVAEGAAGEGELELSGATITPGYWGDPDATARAFTADGWFKTGDLARRDAAGRYEIIGRLKEMYISGGENVWPAEIEAVLQSHPGLSEAAVTAIADPRWGEVGCAWLIARDPAAPPEIADLQSYCRARLSPWKVPRDFRFVPDFPRTASGKVRKSLLGTLS